MNSNRPDYSNLFYMIPFPAWVFDLASLKILDVNQAALSHYGYSKEEFLALSMKDLDPNSSIPDFGEASKNLQAITQNIYFGVFTHQKKSGERIRVEINGQKISLLGKDCVLVFGRDVTKEEGQVKQIKESEERLKAATAIARLGYWRIEIEGDVLSWSDEIFKIWGRKREEFELNFENIFPTIHPEDQAEFEKEHHTYYETGQDHDFVHRIILPDNSIRWVHELGRLVKDENNKPIAFEGTVQDITSQKEEEQRLKLLESVITHTNDAVLITEAEPFDEPGPRIIYVNEAFTKLTGYTAEEVIGKSPRILQGPDSNKEELTKLGQALRKWKSHEITTLNYKKNGEEFWINFTVTPVANEKGWYTHWIAIERDVTDQMNKRREKELFSQISANFNFENDYVRAASEVCQTIGGFGKFDLVELWSSNLEKRNVQLVAHYVKEKEDGQFYQYSTGVDTFRISEGIPGKVWSCLTEVLWSEENQHQAFVRKEAARKIGISAMIGIPLIFKDEVVGVLVIGTKQGSNYLKKFNKIFQHLKSLLGSEINRKKLENNLSHIYDAVPDILCLADFKGRFLKMNKSGCELLGYNEDEILYQTFDEFVHPVDKAIFNNELMKLAEGQTTFKFENRFVTKSNDVVWLSWTCNSDMKDGLIYATAKNITEEKKLRELNRQVNSLAKIGSWEIDLLQEKIYWSDMVHQLHETDPTSFVPEFEKGLKFYRKDFRKMVFANIERCINAGEPFDFEAVLVSVNGKETWVRSIGNAEIVDGKCSRIYGSLQDIHAQKSLELKIREILESIGDAFFSVDKNWLVTYWNKEAENLLGKNRGEVLGKNLWEVYDDAIDSDFFLQYQKAMETQKHGNFEEYYPALDKWFEVSIYPSSSGLSIYFKDVTLRKKADIRLLQANERFEKVTEATNDAIWDWDIKNKTFYRSKGIEKFFGERTSKVLAEEDFWQDKFHPEDLPKIQESLQQCLADPLCHRWEMEYRVINEHGETVFIIDRGLIERDPDGDATRMVGAMTDITELKNQEIQLKSLNLSLNNYALELQRSNEELEQFAYITSHDLQEPLRMVSSFMDLLKKRYGDQLDEKAKQYIHFASDGAKRMKRIILDLLDYSRAGKSNEEKEDVNLENLLSEYRQLRRKIIAEKDVIITYSNLPVIKTYKAAITQIFHCLLDNAIKYSKESSAPEIEITCVENEIEWEFAIIDNGIGIEPEYFDKIFIIFQRLHNKDIYNGTGIGLSIAKKQIEFLGGKIWVESILGEGAIFYFSLPKA